MPFAGYMPVHETFPRKIVEVHWAGDNYVLINVFNDGNYFSGIELTLANSDGDPVPANISIQGVTPLYSRVFTYVKDENVQHWVSVYTPFTGHEGHFSVDYVSFGIVIAPNLDARPATGGGIVSNLQIFAADDTAGILFYLQHGARGGTTFAFTIKALSLEAVYLLPAGTKTYRIENSGFPMAVETFLYPKSLVELNQTAMEWGPYGGPANGRTYFPFNWINDQRPPPFPQNPDGEEWPGAYVNLTPDRQDVINTTVWWLSQSLNGSTNSHQQYPYAIKKVKHLINPLPPPPPPDTPGAEPADPNIRDEIWQVYPTAVRPDDYWSVQNYTDVPLGTVFQAEKWGILTKPGPPPKIDADVEVVVPLP